MYTTVESVSTKHQLLFCYFYYTNNTSFTNKKEARSLNQGETDVKGKEMVYNMPWNVRYDHIIFGAGEGERIEVSERCMIEDYAQNGEILELE